MYILRESWKSLKSNLVFGTETSIHMTLVSRDLLIIEQQGVDAAAAAAYPPPKVQHSHSVKYKKRERKGKGGGGVLTQTNRSAMHPQDILFLSKTLNHDALLLL